MNDLKRRVATGAAWLVLFRLIERGIGLISTLILARLLVPDDFGLVAMATSILAALELLGAFSFDLALIQKQDAQRGHYDTAWTFNVAFGLAKALGMLLLAYPAAVFFSEARVAPVMMVLAIGVVLQGLENIGVVAFQKDLELHKEFWFGLWKKLVGFAVTMAVALTLNSYWALVAGTLAFRLTGLLLSYGLHPFRPRLSLSHSSELLNYSKWLLLNNVLIFLNNRGADFVIGRMAGARALGMYSVAYEISNLPTTELVWPITRAVFPGYSRLAGDRGQLRNAFLQVTGLVALITVPAGAAIGLLAAPLVQLLLGPKWAEIVPLVGALAVFGIIRALHGPTGAVYLAIGKPRMVAALQLVQLAVALSMMLLLMPRFGPLGAAYAVCVGALAAISVNFATVLKDLTMSASALAGAVWRPLAGVAVLAGAQPWTLSGAHLHDGWGRLALATGADLIVGAALYVCTVIVLWLLSGKPHAAEAQIAGFLRARGLAR